MRVEIDRRIYDTSKSDLIGQQISGGFGEPTGFQENFYRKGPHDYFIHAIGGPESPYTEETVAPLELEDAVEWMERNLGQERTKEVLAEDEVKLEERAKRREQRQQAKEKKAKGKGKKSSK